MHPEENARTQKRPEAEQPAKRRLRPWPTCSTWQDATAFIGCCLRCSA